MSPNTPTEPPNLDSPTLYVNRELSSLAFNWRVLAQAQNDEVPLLARLRFLTIVSSNLDEFFEVRVAGLHELISRDMEPTAPDAMSAEVLSDEISKEAHRLIDAQYKTLNEVLLPALQNEGVRILKRSEWSSKQREWVEQHFLSQVLPILSPVGLDPAHPFPPVINKSLNFILSVSGKDAFGRESGIAILQVPRCLPRIVRIPKELNPGTQAYVLISSVIHANVEHIFPGMTINGCYQFRVTRNSDMWVDEDEVDNLLVALKGELHGRNYGAAVRLEVADNCPEHITEFLLRKQGLGRQELYQVNGPVNLHRLDMLTQLASRSDLDYPKFAPGVPNILERGARAFDRIRKSDILLHHPFQSFEPVVWLLQDAASDPDVLAIKMTLYRVGADSPIVNALIDAARANKDVTAIVELRARFDEAANIRLATRLVEAGAKVAYGVVSYKCHAKLMLIVRRENNNLRRYVHVGTGNYHIRNAKLYTDYSLISSNPDLGKDIHHLFMQLTGLGVHPEFDSVLHAPFTLHKQCLELIEQERQRALAGEPAKITAKLNALTEGSMIQALYRASNAGVKIRLIIRGICSLRPQVAQVSENISVCSIVGRMLEHTRVYAFHNGGNPLVYISSADWMDRNLLRRVEAAIPITQHDLKQRILDDMDLYWSDNTHAWDMRPDGKYVLRQSDSEAINAQKKLCQTLGLIGKE